MVQYGDKDITMQCPFPYLLGNIGSKANRKIYNTKTE